MYLSYRCLQMHLKRSSGRLEHHVRVRKLKVIPARHVQPQRSSCALSKHLFVEGEVAVARRDVREREVAIAQRRQDANHDGRSVDVATYFKTAAPSGFKLRLEATQAMPGSSLRRAVQLYIEAGKLWYHQWMREPFQKLLVLRHGQAIATEQTGFELEPDHGFGVIEPTGREPGFE